MSHRAKPPGLATSNRRGDKLGCDAADPNISTAVRIESAVSHHGQAKDHAHKSGPLE
jgi:hypothetical protein